MGKRVVEIQDTKVCSDEYGVTTVVSRGGGKHERCVKPCEQCPWREDVPTGIFPPEAYRTSAPTSYDMSERTFACHMSGASTPRTCAGFLIRHGHHNLSVRLSAMTGRIHLDEVTDGGYPLYPSYREMAIANGVDADDPVLIAVRGD